MFPACAGMNRFLRAPKSPQADVPRMRGDEPYGEEAVKLVEVCSPHARG